MLNHLSLDAIPYGVCLIGRDHHLLDFNRAFYTNFKKSVGTELKLKVSLFSQAALSADVVDTWKHRVNKGLQGETLTYHDLLEFNDKQFRFETVVIPVRNDGFIDALMLVFKDVAASADSTFHLHSQLQKIRSELDRFIYSASHDMRGPVLSIRGLIHLVRKTDLSPEMQAYLTMMEKSIDKLDHYAKQIARYSRNSDPLKFGKIDFRELLDDVVSAQGDALRHGVRILVNVPPQLSFYSDEERVRLICNNIICNAIAFRDRNKASTLKVNVTEGKGKVWLVFADNGIGIHEQHADKVFDMFYKATEIATGPGLGLFIVKEVLDKLKGTITVTSKMGHGSIFKVMLPDARY